MQPLRSIQMGREKEMLKVWHFHPFSGWWSTCPGVRDDAFPASLPISWCEELTIGSGITTFEKEASLFIQQAHESQILHPHRHVQTLEEIFKTPGVSNSAPSREIFKINYDYIQWLIPAEPITHTREESAVPGALVGEWALGWNSHLPAPACTTFA